MVYTCGVCRFTFERSGEVDACPDCGKPVIRTATAEEIAEYRQNRQGALRDDQAKAIRGTML